MALELGGEVCPDQGEVVPLDLGADPTEAWCRCGPSREIAGVAFRLPAGPCAADGAGRKEGGGGGGNRRLRRT